MTTIFNENDVLMGKSSVASTHVGNKQFRKLVLEKRALYLSAHVRKEKREIATSIVEQIRSMNPAGRFLAEDRDRNVWVEVGHKKAIEKTLHRLREKHHSGASDSPSADELKPTTMPPSDDLPTAAPQEHCQEEGDTPSDSDNDDIDSSLMKLFSSYLDADHTDSGTNPNSHTSSISPQTFSMAYNLEPLAIMRETIPLSKPSAAGSPSEGTLRISLGEWIADAARWVDPSQSLTLSLSSTPNEYSDYLWRATKLAHLLVEQLINLPANASISPDSISIDSIFLQVASPQAMKFFRVGTIESLHIDENPHTLSNQTSNTIFRSLANIFYELFLLGQKIPQHLSTNENDSVTFSHTLTLNDNPNRRKLHKRVNHSHPELQFGNLPISLSRLIKDLVNSDVQNEFVADNRFVSLTEVSTDLHQMISDPQRFLYDIEYNANSNALQFHHCFHGRKSEMDTFIDVSKRAHSVFQSGGSCCEIVWISGHSGIGKTTFVHQVWKKLEEDKWKFLSCKFDLMQHAKPFSTISSAFDCYFKTYLTAEQTPSRETDKEKHLNYVVDTTEKSIGQSGILLLCELIPAFRHICILYASNKDLASTLRNAAADHMEGMVAMGTETIKFRIHLIFCKLIQSISSNAFPLFFFLDDLQWADSPSLELLRALVHEFNDASEEGACALLLAGCYRDDENESSEHLTSCKSSMEREYGAKNSNITLNDLEKEDINSMVSEVLCLPRRITRSLSDTLFVKTLGRPLLLKQLIETLVVENLLNFSLSEKRWIWDEDAIIGKSIDTGVAKHFALKLSRLPREMRVALAIASCFGSQIGTKALDYLGNQSTGGLTSALDNAVREGFMLKNGETYKFSHDSIQQAAYDLITPKERNNFHKALASRLINGSSATNEIDPSITFLVVDHVNHVESGVIENPNERKLYSQLNLQAAKHAIDLLNFGSALRYLKAGIGLLEEGHWETNYELSLKLFDSAAFACYIEGRREEMNVYLNEIFSRGKCFEDKFEAYFVLTISLSSFGNLAEAFQYSLKFLDELGESFPEPINADVVKSSIMRTMRGLKDADYHYFDSLPLMANKRKQCAMRLLNILLHLAYRMNSNLAPLIACRMVDLTLSHGNVKESSYGIVGIGIFLISVVRNIEGGYRVGKLAICMLNNPIAEGQRGSVSFLFNTLIASRIQPIQATFEAVHKAYKDRMLAGDIYSAFLAICSYISLKNFSGTELTSLDKECTYYIRKMAHHKQLNAMRILLACHQVIISLIGLSNDPLESFSRGEYSPQKLLQYARLNRDKALLSQIFYGNLRSSFLLEDMNRVEELMNIFYQQRRPSGTEIEDPIISFLEGAVVFRLARRTGDSKWYELGLNHIDVLTRWAKISEWNWENKLHFLKAECHYYNREFEEAGLCYQASIEAACKSRFVHQEGMAYELWGLMCKELGNESKYRSNLKEAHRCFVSWGAHSKVKQIAQRIGV